MLQKCSFIKVLSVFFVEPTSVHFIKSISRTIGLAPTSVRNHIDELLKQNLIKRKKSKPFNGFMANRENEDFIFYKRIYNIFSLKELTDFIINQHFPKLIVVFGSYSIGEDIESSDIDLIIISKLKKNVDFVRFEEKLKRKISLITIENLSKLEENLLKKVYNGVVLYGGF